MSDLITTGTSATTAGDDHVGEDTLDGTDIALEGARTGTIVLVPGAAPTAANGENGHFASGDDTADSSGNYTIDLGFKSRQICVGNLVFRDTNGNGKFDAGAEQGIAGVTVELFVADSDPYSPTTIRQSVVTDANGAWKLCVTTPGNYFAFIPPSQFAKGKPLWGMISSLGVISTGDDNTGEKGMDQIYPAATGIKSTTFSLAYGQAPVTSGVGAMETGFQATSDDDSDSNNDLTIDFGFIPGAGVGNLVFRDNNDNGRFDTAGDEGIPNVEVQLFRSTDTPLSGSPVASVTTSVANLALNVPAGRFLFLGVMPGSYYLYVGPNAFLAGNPLANMISSTGSVTGDDNLGEDGIDSTNPQALGIQTGVFTLATGAMPVNGGSGTMAEQGADFTLDDSMGDSNVDMTRDFGFAPIPMAVGNLVFNDRNVDGKFDAPPQGTSNPGAYDAGIGGVLVQLWSFNTANSQRVTKVAETITATDGSYQLYARAPGSYVVYIPPSEFVGNPVAKVLWSMMPSSAVAGVPMDDEQLAGQNGQPVPNPWVLGVQSNVLNLAYGSQPVSSGPEQGYLNTTDPGVDADSDLTIDFGFYEHIGIGNFVFIDLNGDKTAQASEGAGNVVVEIWKNGSATTNINGGTLAATTTTSQSGGQIGRWLVTGLPPDFYYVKIPASQFTSNGPLAGLLPVVSNGSSDDQGSEDSANVSNPAATGVTSRVAAFFGPVGAAPTATSSGTKEIGQGFDMDDVGVAPWLKDGNVDLTWDLGFKGITITPATLPNGVVNINYSQALTAAGGTAPYTWVVSSGILPSGLSMNTSTGLIAGLPLATGTYTWTVRATDSQSKDGYRTYTISITTAPPLAGVVKRDLLAEGDPDGSNVPLAGVTVTLFADTNGNGSLEPDESDAPLESTVTDAEGAYVFDQVAPGDYLVEQSLLPGALATYDTDGGDKHCTSVRVATDAVNGVDFLQCYEPTGLFYDTTSGLIIPGGAVAVSGPGIVKTIHSGENGAYCFSVDVTGDYEIQVTTPPGYIINPDRPALSTTWTCGTTQTSMVSIGSAESRTEPGRLANYSSEANPWHLRLHLNAGSPCAVNNNIPLTPVAPDTFAQWRSRHPLNGANGVHDNPDADAFDNLIEYALALDPESGVQTSGVFHLVATAAGDVDAVFARSIVGHSDVSYRLEGSTDGAAWSALALAPAVEAGTDGMEEVRYASIQTAAMFAARDIGYVRLQVRLDVDRDGTPESTSVTPVFAFSLRQFPAAQGTFAMPLLRTDVFVGKVDQVTSGKLEVASGVSSVGLDSVMTGGGRYYVEVLSGTHAGHRFDVDTATSTDKAIAIDLASTRNTLDTLPASLKGERIALRPHWTLETLFPRTKLQAGTASGTADRVMFYEPTGFKVHWLLRTATDSRWMIEGDATATHPGQRVMDASEGVIVQFRAALTLPMVGQVRDGGFVAKLRTGSQLTGTGSTIAQSTTDRGMTGIHGFIAAEASATADRVRIFSGDASPGTTSYVNYFYKSGSVATWVSEADGSVINDVKIFLPFRAAFISTSDGALIEITAP